MVDWCLGFKLDKDDIVVIRKAYDGLPPNDRALNQSLSYVKRYPLILDIEIKKTLQMRDPEVQLAIWASSALRKKQIMGWDTSMPMPAIAIEGHDWRFFILFATNDELVRLFRVIPGAVIDPY